MQIRVDTCAFHKEKREIFQCYGDVSGRLFGASVGLIRRVRTQTDYVYAAHAHSFSMFLILKIC